MARQGKKDHRTADITRRQGIRIVKQSFLIVCEGVRTEPEYFKSFRITTATVKAVGQAMNTLSLVNKAISIRDADEKKKRSYDQCWVVFDKDDFPAKDFSTKPYSLPVRTDFMWRTAIRRLNIGSCCTSICIKVRYIETAMPGCCLNLLECRIPRTRASELLCITGWLLCSNRPSRMQKPCWLKFQREILRWKSPPRPYICLLRN